LFSYIIGVGPKDKAGSDSAPTKGRVTEAGEVCLCALFVAKAPPAKMNKVKKARRNTIEIPFFIFYSFQVNLHNY
jgi:hypothetical protein